MPATACLRPALLLKLYELPAHLWIPTLYALHGEGSCSEDEVASFELLKPEDRASLVKTAIGGLPAITTEKAPIKRRRGLSRQERVMRRPRFMGIRFVRRVSLDPFLSWPLSSGAKMTLLYLIARAGKTRAFSKRTCLVATDLGIAQRTLQTHYVALEKAGFIRNGGVDPDTGATTIVILSAVEPPAFKKREETDAAALTEGAQNLTPTQPIKDLDSMGYVESENLGDAERDSAETAVPSSQEPGAVLSRPAQPRARALGSEEVVAQAFSENRNAQRDPERRGAAGLTPFDQHLNATLVAIMGNRAKFEESQRVKAGGRRESKGLESQREGNAYGKMTTAVPLNRVFRR